MLSKSLWGMVFGMVLIGVAHVQAADRNGNWADGWAYFEQEDDPAEPEAAKAVLCGFAFDHRGSPCDCPTDGLDDEFEGECENPFGNDDEFLKDFEDEFADDSRRFADELPDAPPVLRDACSQCFNVLHSIGQVECTSCKNKNCPLPFLNGIGEWCKVCQHCTPHNHCLWCNVMGLKGKPGHQFGCGETGCNYYACIHPAWHTTRKTISPTSTCTHYQCQICACK